MSGCCGSKNSVAGRSDDNKTALESPWGGEFAAALTPTPHPITPKYVVVETGSTQVVSEQVVAPGPEGAQQENT